MKKYFFGLLIIPFLFSCNGNENNDLTDSAGKRAINTDSGNTGNQVHLRRDTFLIDKTKSSFTCTRSKTVKDVDKEIRIGNSVMHMKMGDASFSASTSIVIYNALWETGNGVFAGGSVILDMTSVTTLQIGDDEKIKAGNPGYLETKKYPTALLQISAIDSIPGNAKQMQVTSYFTIKDSTAKIVFPASVEFSDAAHPVIPTKLSGSFHIDGIKWGLNPKNAKVTKDDLAFKVSLLR